MPYLNKIILTICLLSCGISKAQSGTLYGLDTSAYPIMKANFLLFDKAEKQILTLTKEDFVISENQIAQRVIRVTNPEYREPEALSVVLTADISGSMRGDNLGIVKNVLKAFVTYYPLQTSECALTSFDHNNYIDHDFSRNKGQLLASIDQLSANGGTNYYAGLLQPLTGGLEVARSGKHKKVLIFLTDGLGQVNEQEVIEFAAANNITVYCLVVGMPAPEVLKNIAQKTGGKYMENIFSEDEARQAYFGALYREQKRLPSTVEWECNPDCSFKKKLDFEVPSLKMNFQSYAYTLDRKHLRLLEVSSHFVRFPAPKKGKYLDTTLTLKALNRDFTVESIHFDHPAFSAPENPFPMVIKRGSSAHFKIRYTSGVNGPPNCLIELKTDRCSPIVLRATSESMKSKITLDNPNGGEVFYVGTDTTVAWSGVSPYDSVELRYSSTNGGSYQYMNKTSGLNYGWHVPDLESNQMLMKVTVAPPSAYVIDANENGTHFTGKNNLSVSQLFMTLSPNNDRMICRKSGDDYIQLYDIRTGELLLTIEDRLPATAYFNGKGDRMYVFKPDSLTKVYDVYTLEKIGTRPGHSGTVFCINREGTKYTVYNENNTEIRDLESGKLLKVIPGHGDPDSFTDRYLTVSGESITIWDWPKGEKVWSFQTSVLEYYSQGNAWITRDEKYILLNKMDESGTPLMVGYDLSARKEVWRMHCTKRKYTSWEGQSFNGTLLLFEESENHWKLLDVASGIVMATIKSDLRMKNVELSNDGSFFTVNHLVKGGHQIFNIKTDYKPFARGEDVSNSVFRIIRPVISGKDIYLGKVTVGEYKDSLCKTFFRNPHKIPVKILYFWMEGSDAKSFSLVSGMAPRTLAASQSGSVEFRFAPSHIGSHTAKLFVATALDTLQYVISGEGISIPSYSILSFVHMGSIPVGSMKDSTINFVVKNTGSKSINFSAFKLIDPDRQFHIPSYPAFELAPGANKSIRVTFRALQRGRTSARLRVQPVGFPSSKEIILFGEGVSPSEYEVNVVTLDDSTRKRIAANIICVDLEIGTPLKSVVSRNGVARFLLYADRKYKLTATHPSYITTFDTVDLRNPSPIAIIKDTLLLHRNLKASRYYIVSGKISDKKNMSVLPAKVVCYKIGGSESVVSTTADTAGYFQLIIPQGGQYKIRIEHPDYLPAAFEVNEEDYKEYSVSKLTVGENISLNAVHFVQSKAELLPESFEQLDILVSLLKERKGIYIELSGHTDNVGGSKEKLQLSKERVLTIQKYLIDAGIEPKRITGKGYGDTRPCATNNTEESRKLNRRVEFKITKM
jgi:outer membrane protein OmpA-like peptidoglycan-associated protein/WD40 repeat protein